MNTFENPYTDDPAAARTAIVASLVGRELLLRELTENGVADADETTIQIVAEVVRAVSSPSKNDLTDLAHSLDRGLKLVAGSGAQAADVVARAQVLADQNVTTFSGGPELASIVADVVYGIVLLLVIAKTHLHFDFKKGELSGGLDPGVPSGLTPIVSALSSGIASMIHDKGGNKGQNNRDDGRDAGGLPRNDLTKASETSNPSPVDRTEADNPENDRAAGPRQYEKIAEGASTGTAMSFDNRSVAVRAAGRVLQPGGGPLSQLPVEPVSLSDAIPLRDRLFSQLNYLVPEISELLAEQYGSGSGAGRWPETIFTKSASGFSRRLGHSTSDPLWPFEVPFTFGVGLLQDPASRQPGRPVRFRLAIRIQSPHEIRSKAVKWLSDRFKELSPLISLRWSSPIVALQSNPEGIFRPWSVQLPSGPSNMRLVVGAPMNVAGGAVGALSLILCDDNDFYALTAGHPIWHDCGAAVVDTVVYCEPQSLTPSPHARVGTVQRAEVFPSFRVNDPPPRPGWDYTIVRLDPGVVPIQARRNLINGKQFTASIYDVPALTPETADDPAVQDRVAGLFGKKVEKSAAKTAGCRGHINQLGFRIEFIDAATRSPIVGTDLVEVVMDSGADVQRGDSGALLCVDEQDALHPLGFVVAGQRTGRLHKQSGATSLSVYAQPLASIDHIRGMRVA